MSERIRIRIAVPEDAENILAVYAPYIEKTAISFEYTVPTVDEFRSRIENTLQNYPYLVAEIDGKIVGYTYASSFHTRAAYKHTVETSIYVAEGCHERGIGRTLYEKLEELLLKQNVYTLYACTTYSSQDDSHLLETSPIFHEHMGYRIIGAHENCGYKFGKWYSIQWHEKKIREIPEHVEPFIPFSQIRE